MKVGIAEDGSGSALRWLSYWDSMWEIMMMYVCMCEVRHGREG